MSQAEAETSLINLTARIVAAYIQNNAIDRSQVTEIISSVHASLNKISGAKVEAQEQQKPAISIRNSITPDYIICLEDGKKFKIMKRHLTTVYGMTPAEYRRKWNLPPDYPMVAPNYAKSRSEYAREKQRHTAVIHNLKTGTRARGRALAREHSLPVIVRPG
ncbi:transcriptional regulator [Camelimonas fluminis]|uniref:MucR family transcriptional regulator n=1 Tax=Camelimonas fluminis TaxID=1576911 RepID=A0ABV7UD12_9HYPH|nr:MucR family transcriptional regulator [Camelimonas fluminis]GHE47989.1 transcriptional regulator [Camelimonas fluminis]